MDYLERVERGISLLDAHFEGRGWMLDLDMWEFDILSLAFCPVARLFGGFRYGCEQLGIDPASGEAGKYGFDLLPEEYADNHKLHAEALNMTWETALGEEGVIH